MPDERVVYARRKASGFALETAGLDGSAALRLSYLPGNFIPDDVLLDGRVLFESNFPLGADATLQPMARSAGSQAEMFLVYADGSGVESVRCDHPDGLKTEGREHGREIGVGSRVAGTGDIVFTQRGRLAKFTSALADEARLRLRQRSTQAMSRSCQTAAGSCPRAIRTKGTSRWRCGRREPRR